MKVRKIRLLRLKYGITCKELGAAAGISAQRVSQIELCEAGISEETKIKLKKGLEKIIFDRKESCETLTDAYAQHRDSLFELVMETAYEL